MKAGSLLLVRIVRGSLVEIVIDAARLELPRGGFNFTVIGRASGTAALTCENLNGLFTVELATGAGLELSGCNAVEGNYIEILVDGVRDERVIVQNGTRIAGDPQTVPCAPTP